MCIGHPLSAKWCLSLILATLLLICGACRPNRSSNQGSTNSPTPGETQSDSKPAENPSFEGRIQHVSMYPVPNHREDLAVTLVVIVSNSGSASGAEGWHLEVNSRSRRVPTVLEPVHVNGIVELPGANGTKVDLGKEDLVRKTAQISIDKGASVKGVLTFVL